MGENFRPIPVPENKVLSCGVQRDIVSSVVTTFSNQPGSLSPRLRGGACDGLLGKFHLNEISPMPRDAFDIDVDANGILNVSAQDESTTISNEKGRLS